MSNQARGKYPESSTTRRQRLAIWIIAIVMIGGTLVSFVIFAIMSMNPGTNPQNIEMEKAIKLQEEQQAEAQRAQAEMRKSFVSFYDGLPVGRFDAASITTLKVSELRAGDGAIVSETNTISANYTGWNADGEIFDTTKVSKDATSQPREFALNQVIEGWTKGLTGRKVGGVYLLEIPADLAYGPGSGFDPTGRPLGALKFVVEIVSIVE